jgi:hypothetical protein
VNVLDQVRLIVAERQIVVQNRELQSLRLRTEIAGQRAALQTALQNPMVQLGAILSLYLVGTLILDSIHSKKEKPNA